MYNEEQKAKIKVRARYFYTACGFYSLISAIRAAIAETQIFPKLYENPMVYLTYKKKDRTIQHAFITTQKDYIPEIDRVKGTGSGYTYFQVRFYDTVKRGWRSCLLQNIIAVHW
jgi:hypothetical protein